MATPIVVGDDDVILGRGLGPNRIEGNIRFRRIVWETYLEYKSSCSKAGCDEKDDDDHGAVDASVKNEVARRVLEKYKESGKGRFLRKVSTWVYPAIAMTVEGPTRLSYFGGQEYYEEVPDRDALQKIKESVRFQVQVKRHRRNGPDNCDIPPASTPHTASTKLIRENDEDDEGSSCPPIERTTPCKRKSRVQRCTVSSSLPFRMEKPLESASVARKRRVLRNTVSSSEPIRMEGVLEPPSAALSSIPIQGESGGSQQPPMATTNPNNYAHTIGYRTDGHGTEISRIMDLINWTRTLEGSLQYLPSFNLDRTTVTSWGSSLTADRFGTFSEGPVGDGLYSALLQAQQQRQTQLNIATLQSLLARQVSYHHRRRNQNDNNITIPSHHNNITPQYQASVFASAVPSLRLMLQSRQQEDVPFLNELLLRLIEQATPTTD